jgi:hypothetical protein
MRRGKIQNLQFYYRLPWMIKWKKILSLYCKIVYCKYCVNNCIAQCNKRAYNLWCVPLFVRLLGEILFPFFHPIFKILKLFVRYFKNYMRQMVSWNCKHVQHVKIYLPCNFEVNLITHLGVIWKKENNSKMGNGIYFKIAG